MKSLKLILIFMFSSLFVHAQEQNQEESDSIKIVKVAKLLEKRHGYINNRNSVYEKGILVSIKGIYVNNKKLFFVFETKNKSNLDYDISGEFFNTTPISREREKVALEEKVFMPIWTNNISVLKKKSTTRLIYVFDKFTLNDNKVLNFILREENGEREINLKIKPDKIIEARYIMI